MTTVDLHVTTAGEGRPLVLLHAFPLSSVMWQEQLDGLVGAARVIAPDLRGFGASPMGAGEPSLDLMADDVAVVLDRYDVDSAVVGGLSMGGYVAMALLRRHPDRIAGLVLADTKAGADPDPAREKRHRIADRLERERSPDALVDEVLPALTGATTSRERPDVPTRVRAMLEEVDPAAAAWAQRAMAARPDSHADLRAAQVPALVVWGDEDELSTRDDSEAMAAALPQGRLAVLEGAGHLSAIETPEAFTGVVADFLRELR
jgi:pimeloyl-ACP methyl ester carboxylesterase